LVKEILPREYIRWFTKEPSETHVEDFECEYLAAMEITPPRNWVQQCAEFWTKVWGWQTP